MSQETVTVLAVGGTGESHPSDHRTRVTGLLACVTRELDDRFVGRWIGYPASYGPVALGGLCFRHSADIGVRRLRRTLESTAGPIALIGYSQGATVVREVLGLVHDGTIDGSRIVAAGLVSDPQQPVGAVDGCTGRGVAGAGPALPESIPVQWIGLKSDMICNASDDSLIRDVADLTRWMSFRTPKIWLRELLNLLRSNSFQNATRTRLRPSQWAKDVRRLRTAAAELGGYLPQSMRWRRFEWSNPGGGRHIAYAREDYADGLTGCQVLARWLGEQADLRENRLSPSRPQRRAA
ncbi:MULTISPECIES: PE-PPE domain-containing protein [unclassified Rhodococcus (in: high G+C Gram-positive bacteria)]|uniref:PE-PPE domain-containing protein n=1 Tax=unclassified Rhodococcus (in: high G+C Gram-positive bacteria) TaxID=192944 RepID=UPI0007BC7E5C|nr:MULTISPECIES: PE-PPE domain-containing protein [unclassified Rhodococcus (in: high G+C Gram-positive bacteria)]KZF00339.1 PE-PPE domain-containing protein [Rhodococcus sp. EPR-147]KZF01838.1 PE-PPE domain-containing protein [Rhodococcus sp. EPR-279]OZE33251.1 PE-PPE domain-containing protein [Rhodococcus sp. 05-2254-4]OZE43854.1 PE-PPE domain-containing protein [Rhodococcus sp. 05-2254-3]OZE56462.1 PE-PPE domain-containing protein [Rhodococcus sp. 05-2254-2]